VPLQPAEPNKLVGTLAQPLGAGARVVVSATMADGHGVQAQVRQQLKPTQSEENAP
jgi:hypothetical protein